MKRPGEYRALLSFMEANMEHIDLLVQVLAGLAAVIPLVVELVKYVQKATKEKNWNAILKLTIDYMKTAETMFEDGASRKEWVLAMVQSSAVSINYDLDEEALAKISELIDSICAAADVINKDVAAA